MKNALPLLLSIFSHVGLSCSCSDVLENLNETFEFSDYVAKARVANVEVDSSAEEVNIELQIIETWKGPTGGPIHVTSSMYSSLCGIVPNVGDILITFTHDSVINGCSTFHIDGTFPSELEKALDMLVGKVLETENSHLLPLYPNPAKDILHLNFSYNQLDIYSRDGRLILKLNDGKKNTLTISHLKPGIYFVEYKSLAQKETTRHKIIKE